MKHKSKEFIINTPYITFWRAVSPRLVKCHLGASVKIVELNQGVCKGKEIAYFVKIYPSVVGDGHGGIDKVASSWTLRGWSCPWTRATVTLRGLKSPPTWIYDSTTYRNHAKNLRVSKCVCTLQSHPFTFLQTACFTFRCSYTLCMLA